MKRLLNQSGVVHTLPLLFIVVAVGVISFLLVSSAAPFKGGLFSTINPKPASNAATPMPSGMMGLNLLNNDCNLPGQAFCDTFDAPFKEISRTGQLDPTRWEVNHISTGANTDQGMYDQWALTDAMYCKQRISGVFPPNDYFECDGDGTESNHFMEATNDASSYMYNDELILQPFDFANRTGTITFNVDAKTSGGHGWWIEMWVVPDPEPAPHQDPGHVENLRDGIGLFFQDDCTNRGGQIAGPDAGSTMVAMSRLEIARNGVADSSTPVNSQCVKTQPDMRNLIQVKISQTHLEVWASDYDGTNFRMVSSADFAPLTFTRGYLHFQDSHYDAFKAFNCNGCISEMVTYHWDNVGFDGPVLPLLHKASVPDALVVRGDGQSINLGYRFNQGLDNGPLSTTNLDLTGANQAWLAANFVIGTSLSYQLNGGAWHSYAPFAPGLWTATFIPVSLSELKNGVNTINFKSDDGTNSLVANADIYAASNSPVVAPSPCPSCPTPTPFVTPVPTPFPTPSPSPVAPNPLPFNAEYWNSGTGSFPSMPTTSANLTRTDNGIFFDWGNGSPDPSINADHFIARWTGTLNVPTAGNYTFNATADDGVRFYVDNNLVIDHWVDEAATTYSAPINLTVGTHVIKMEYYENTGGAVAKLTWTASVPTATPAPSATPVTCPKKSLGDVDCDGTIGIFDFNALISNFGKTGTGLQGDLDGSGKVDIFDFNTLVTNFGH